MSMRYSKILRRLSALCSGFALGLSPGALAQNAASSDTYVGLGIWARPAYEGAASTHAQAIPYLRYYGDYLFARTTQGTLESGVQFKPATGLALGAQLAYEDGRVTDDSAFLKAHHVENIAAGASVGVHAEADWTIGPMPLNALLRFRQNFKSSLGAQTDIRLSAGVYSQSGVSVGVFGQLTWSDSKASQSYFGFTPPQAAATGLPVYSAGAGLRFAAIGVLGSVDVSTHWLILWGGSMQRMAGAARSSPIVQDGTNWYANAGLAYRF